MSKVRVARILVGCGMLALSTATLAQASQPAAEQAPAAEEAEGEASDSAIVVTGSRIVRNGYQAPTPVTVMTTEEMSLASPTNIADGLRTLPQFGNSFGQTGAGSPTSSPFLTNIEPASTGNYMDLRGLGAERVLILLDGRRVPPTSSTGYVDTNILPQALMQRVDVVTGGASAVYGADAVSGVVNFVLDTKFTGIKGLIQTGISDYRDAENVRLSLAGGMPFAGGRGHALFSVEYYNNAGVRHRSDRPYLNDPNEPYYLAGAGTAANPYNIIHGARNIQYTPGGMITGVLNAAGANNAAGAALLNLRFVTDKLTTPFQFGQAVGTSSVRLGGDGTTGTPEGTGAAGLRTIQAFSHVRYDLTDDITAFVQGAISEARTQYTGNWDSRAGTSALTIYSGNAYLPANIQQMMTDTGTASFRFARQLLDFPGYDSEVKTNAFNITAGLEGSLGLFGKDWKWDVYYTHGDSRANGSQVQNENRNLYAAMDAVVDPSSGNIVCRVSITNPGLLPGCVPVNLFGAGTPSAAAIDFISDVSRYRVVNKLDEVAVNFGGSPFSTWAGPVSINIGASYRYQSIDQTSNANPTIAIDYTGIRGVSNASRFGFTNIGVTKGNYNAKEVFAETVVPLLTDAPFAKLLELNGAGRFTNYSTSGSVWTWKAGLSYQPVDGVRFRVTRSKDIRAPTLRDLFSGRSQGLVSFADVGVTNLTQINTQFTGGNPDLKPEVAYTTAFGVVLQPGFLPGFSLSVDYYSLKIQDAISNISSSTAHNDCVASGGTSPLCALFDRPLGGLNPDPANFPRSFFATSVNLASLATEGLDIEASYTTELSAISSALPGEVRIRGLATYVPKYETNAGAGARTLDAAGTAGRQKWGGLVSVNYGVGPFAMLVQSRIVGASKRDTPENTGFIYLQNDLPAQAYFDLTLSYDLEAGNKKFTPFITINNLANRKALLVPTTFLPNVPVPTLGVYDYIGRRYTAGVRFNF